MDINNEVILTGKFTGEFKYSHTFENENYKEKFYLNEFEIKRDSGVVDKVIVLLSECYQDDFDTFKKNIVRIYGELRTHNNEQKKLLMHVFPIQIEIVKDNINNNNNNKTNNKGENKIIDIISRNDNFVRLNGFICKQPIIRQTPKGKQISNVLIAVNRPYGKSDYVPCIVWNKLAHTCKKLNTGDQIEVFGRLQSRTYDKNGKEFTTYEVSCSEMFVRK